MLSSYFFRSSPIFSVKLNFFYIFLIFLLLTHFFSWRTNALRILFVANHCTDALLTLLSCRLTFGETSSAFFVTNYCRMLFIKKGGLLKLHFSVLLPKLTCNLFSSLGIQNSYFILFCEAWKCYFFTFCSLTTWWLTVHIFSVSLYKNFYLQYVCVHAFPKFYDCLCFLWSVVHIISGWLFISLVVLQVQAYIFSSFVFMHFLNYCPSFLWSVAHY